MPGNRIAETIAVYWEPKVKTYGFQIETGLCLVEIGLGSQQWVAGGDRLRKLDVSGVSFLLVIIQPAEDGGGRVYLLVEDRHQAKLLQNAKGFLTEESEDLPVVISPVEMIHFQGPHFGDRFGIADAAFRALKSGDVQVLAAACTGASITIVMPEGKSAKARTILEEVFEIPKKSTRIGHRSGGGSGVGHEQ